MNESIVLGGGCFWCIEAVYQRVKGVSGVTSGYSGGKDEPTYETVHLPYTEHAEVVKVDYDPSIITLNSILEVFWSIHDPTTLNRQGNDVGPAYRSIIFFTNPEQKDLILKSIDEVAKKIWDKPVVTEVRELDKFHEAEEYHQDYFNKNPDQGYCQLIINPKIKKFEKHFKNLLK